METIKTTQNLFQMKSGNPKRTERDKLVEQLNSNNNSLKDLWKALKDFIKPDLSGI